MGDYSNGRTGGKQTRALVCTHTHTPILTHRLKFTRILYSHKTHSHTGIFSLSVFPLRDRSGNGKQAILGGICPHLSGVLMTSAFILPACSSLHNDIQAFTNLPSRPVPFLPASLVLYRRSGFCTFALCLFLSSRYMFIVTRHQTKAVSWVFQTYLAINLFLILTSALELSLKVGG